LIVKRIVVGVDGSDGSVVALRWALEEARYRNLPLLVVMAWQEPALTTIPLYGIEPRFEEAQDAAAQRLLDVLRDEGVLDAPDVEVLTRVIHEAAGPALLMSADADDILVVGSRRHAYRPRMILGSVSRHCATHARCPVVVVPIPQAESPTA
jgi:nucleotide-binding universal stress UspA family protein